MNKLWCVFSAEYVRRVKAKGFLFATISMPLIIILVMGLGLLSIIVQSNTLPIGYQDLSGVFANAEIPSDFNSFPVKPIDMIPFTDLENGREAVDKGEIQAFFIIPTNYLESGEIEVFIKDEPGQNAYERMRDFLQKNLIASESGASVRRIEEGSNFTVKAFDGSREADASDWFTVMFPFLIGIIFVIVINISGGYLLQSVTDEKENRTMEMIITSISPEELMVGKILGNLSVGLTQLFIWLLFVVLGLIGAQVLFHFSQPLAFQPIYLVFLAGLVLPGFVTMAALMTIVGVTSTEFREAQQVSVIFSLLMVAPFWFINPILQNPQATLATFLSIFPLTSIVTMPLRVSISSVPAWQMIAAFAVMWFSAFFTLWLSAKAFRLGMLSYRKRIHIKEVLSGRRMHV